MSKMFDIRYKRPNIFWLKRSFFIKDYKKILRSNPLLAPIIVPILAVRKMWWHLEHNQFLEKIYSFHLLPSIKKNPLLTPIFVLLSMLKKSLKILKKFFNILPSAIVNFRLLRGKVDIPYFELVLTTKCSLRCESCNNLMQYFDAKNAYTCSLQGIIEALNTLLKHIDSVRNVRIIGGEPLLFKDIAKVVEFLDNEPKVKSFDIVTNGTIIPKNDLLLALQKSHKSFVTISDYSTSPNIKIPLHYDKIIEILESHKISYFRIFSDGSTKWINPQAIFKRNRTKNDIIKNFKSCLMPCVSVMSSEGIMRNAAKIANALDLQKQNSQTQKLQTQNLLVGGGQNRYFTHKSYNISRRF